MPGGRYYHVQPVFNCGGTMNSKHDHEERVLALAGLVQAVHLISTISRSGMAAQDHLEASLNSIFVTSPGSASDVYGGGSGVSLGIKLTTDLIMRFNLLGHVDVVRYALLLLQLERRLAQHPDCLRELGAGISSIDKKRTFDLKQQPINDAAVEAELAALYRDTLGCFEPRIKVQGHETHLRNSFNINRIRALLLAGMRSAVLWHQLGGRRWHLIAARKPLINALANM